MIVQASMQAQARAASLPMRGKGVFIVARGRIAAADYSTFQLPDLPPCFSITLMSDITMPRSMALHMS